YLRTLLQSLMVLRGQTCSHPGMSEQKYIPTDSGSRLSLAAAICSWMARNACWMPAICFFYHATGITPAMSMARLGSGSAYAWAVQDAKSNYFDGGKTYKITLPAPIPAKEFWSFVVYDNETRSLLETDQKLAGVDSTAPGLKKNPDGSVTVWLGPKAPADQESNWIQTMPRKGWNVVLRLYGPLEPWFNKTWKPGDFELVQ